MTAYQPRPGTRADRILAALGERPEGASDAELSRHLRVPHEAVNQVCRQLVVRGLLIREPRSGTLINRIAPVADRGTSTALSSEGDSVFSPHPSQLWSWEGNVQARVVNFLAQEGWTIRRVADTARREPGKDIEAEQDGLRLWVSVKGFPVGTARTQPYTQAPHWFAGALFDIVLWRQDAPHGVHFAVALPRYPTYETLAKRTNWLVDAAPFNYLWVSEDGAVRWGPGMPRVPTQIQ
jgi:hypothetical protein